MADFIGWIGDVLTVTVATVDTVAITPGLVLAAVMISSYGFRFAKRLKGFG